MAEKWRKPLKVNKQGEIDRGRCSEDKPDLIFFLPAAETTVCLERIRQHRPKQPRRKNYTKTAEKQITAHKLEAKPFQKWCHTFISSMKPSQVEGGEKTLKLQKAHHKIG